MINFLQPLWLLGLTAAAVPALLHLLKRRIPPTVPFPAVRYLAETERRHSRRLRLRQLLLMLLRMAVIVLLVLAAAGPVARVPFGGQHAPAAIALVVDNSLSSGAVVGGRRVADAIAEEARAVLGRVAPADHLWLVFADGVPARMTRAEAVTRLDHLTPATQRLDLGAATRAAARVVHADPLGGEVVVVSDLQASAWSTGAPTAAPVLVWSPPAGPANRAIDSAAAMPPTWVGPGQVSVTVGGNGSPADLALEIDGRVAARALATPGGVVTLDVPAPAFGWHVGHLALASDELRGDDAWWLALRRAPPPRVDVRPGAGPFAVVAVGALERSGHVAPGDAVTVDDALHGTRTLVLPPSDPALVGSVNRALAARGMSWRYGAPLEGAWPLAGGLPGLDGGRVRRRFAITGGTGANAVVLARAGGAPWAVREGDVVLLGSRLDTAWTTLPVSAGFVPFLERVLADLATGTDRRLDAAPGDVVSLPPGVTALVRDTTRITAARDGSVTAPLAPGVYFLVGGAGDTVGALDVNHDARESRLDRADGAVLAASLGPRATLEDAAGLDRDLFGGARRADLAGVLLALALVAAVAELIVASRGGRG